MEPIPAKELDQYVEKRGYRIVDLRTREEFVKGHIRGAINVPEGRIGTWFFRYRQDVLILYCDRGAMSMSVARDFEKAGWRTKSVVGGIRAYHGENLVSELDR